MSAPNQALGSQAAASSAPPARRQGHRWILVLLLVGLVSTVILTISAGSAATFALLRNANLWFVGLIVLTQLVRYLVMTLSTRVVAQIVHVKVPFIPLFEATVAAQAANRTFVGGAAGLVIRLAFFVNYGMPAGTFVGVEGIEDGVSLVAVALLFLSGLTIVLASGAGSGFRWNLVGTVIGGAVILVAAFILLLRHREWVYAIADAVARFLNRLFGRLLKRNLYEQERIHTGVDDFYEALALARRDPGRVFISFLCSLARLGCDATALYFAFRAIGYTAPPATVLFIFIVSTSIATVTAVPGQIGVMETSLAVMSTALGIPAPVAVGATLLFRLISFWLPIPFGYAFAWHLERTGQL